MVFRGKAGFRGPGARLSCESLIPTMFGDLLTVFSTPLLMSQERSRVLERMRLEDYSSVGLSTGSSLRSSVGGTLLLFHALGKGILLIVHGCDSRIAVSSQSVCGTGGNGAVTSRPGDN